MGGAVEEVVKLTEEQITARLIEIGRNSKLANPHTVWVVEDLPPTGPFYRDRSDLDNICYSMATEHLERFPFSIVRLQSAHIAFFPYKDYKAASTEALRRLALDAG